MHFQKKKDSHFRICVFSITVLRECHQNEKVLSLYVPSQKHVKTYILNAKRIEELI